MMRAWLSRITPFAGAVGFGVLHFFARIGADWLFRSFIPDYPMPPLWSLLLTQALGSAAMAFVIYILLHALHRQSTAVRDLNHELRNALQVFSYILPQCAPGDADRGRAAVQRMTMTIAKVSRELGVTSAQEREVRKKTA